MPRPKVRSNTLIGLLLTSTAGLFGLTTAMAVTLQAYGIRCNVVSPGRIKATHENRAGDENGDKWSVNEGDAETHPTNRAGMVEDITEAAEYLLGAGFVTGENLTVDGGINVNITLIL